MLSIRNAVGKELKWHRTSLLPAAYELRMGEDVLATLAWGCDGSVRATLSSMSSKSAHSSFGERSGWVSEVPFT